MRGQKIIKYNLEELMSFLSVELNKTMNELITYCKESKMTLQKSKGLYDNMMRVIYKGRTVFTFDIREDGNVNLILTVVQPQDAAEVFAKQAEDLRHFFVTRLKYASHIGENGHKLGFNNPTNEEMQYIKQLINIRRENIN